MLAPRPGVVHATAAMCARMRDSSDTSDSDAGVGKGLSTREVAAALGVTERTVRRAIARGELPAAVRAGAYRVAAAALAHYRAALAALPPHPRPARRSRPGSTPAVALQPLSTPLTPLIGREREIAA